jgi:glycosyltransferase involved in cell wall biosynthesis
MNQPATKILLGPANELHIGVHRPLVAFSPAGYEYVTAGATHYFLLPKGVQLFEPLSPHRYFHLGELLYFDDDASFVHTSRFPVVGRGSWIMDLDNFGYPFVAGRAILNPVEREKLIDIDGLHEDAIRRIENMLYACSHPSCRSVIFWTETALQSAKEQISANHLQKLGRNFLDKSVVVYPAQAPISKDKFTEKWKALESGRAPLTIMFCGRDYAVKNGDLALQVFDRVLERHPDVRIIYVGNIPHERQHLLAHVLKKIEYYDDVPRPHVLDLLADAHILVHPSSNESLGVIYLEAFAAGLAVIGAFGEGLRHIPEMLSPEGARVVDYTEGNHPLWVEAYLIFLESLIETPEIAKRMGHYNYGLVASDSGKFSLSVRDRAFRAIYGGCVSEKPGLQLEELPYWKDSVLFSMDSTEIQQDFEAYAREIGFEGCNLAVGYPLKKM